MRRAGVAFAILALLVGAMGFARFATTGSESPLSTEAGDGRLGWAAEEFLNANKEPEFESQGSAAGGGGEAAEQRTQQAQWAQARTAPGIVNPGAYSAAFGQMTGLDAVGGTWTDITATPYDADDPLYRDYYSNSSGGSGNVTGRITGIAADADGYVYAAGANGGVWRSTQGGGNWTPIADQLPSLSGGDLQLAADGSLWYATGEANTGGTSYVGAGVFRLASPRTGTFDVTMRVGGDELESTTINALRFDGAGRVWAATLRGVWWHSATTFDGPWTLAYAPNPGYLPSALSSYSTTQSGFGSVTTGDARYPNAGYKNIVNDLAIDPKNVNHVIAAIGWRGGDTYNGFYETKNRGTSWVKVNPGGAINPKEIGNASFAWSGDQTKLYVMNESISLYNKLTGTVNSLLDGIYVSGNGSLAGPWTKIADSTKLANSGSALKQALGGKGYGPGVQSWYNQFLIVDPSNRNHVIAGLEEVYETKDGGSSWMTVGPYWNFYFSCWRPDAVYPPNGTPNGCPQTTHPDQHSAAVGTSNGTRYLFVGNDGGIYRRPLNGTVNRNKNATDWESLNDGTIDALQYYSVAVGLADASADTNAPGGSGVVVSGGLQDNGGSLGRAGGMTKMSSNFGGDGGDTLVDPNHGCNIVQEYVYLSMRVTQNCARNSDPYAFFYTQYATTWDIRPPEVNARFIAPFTADANNSDRWLAGGHSLWFNNVGYSIRNGSQWSKVYTLPEAYAGDPRTVTTAIGYHDDVAVAAWCGPTCNNFGFARGAAVGTFDGTNWSWVDVTAALDASNVPNRYIGGATVAADGTIYLAVGGFSRRFTEGPGAGIGHVFKSTDGGSTWTSVDGSGATAFPDIPANSVTISPSGGLIVGTDLGVFYLASTSSDWKRLGGTTLPVTTTMKVVVGPDGYAYAATHGRGIWRLDVSGL